MLSKYHKTVYTRTKPVTKSSFVSTFFSSVQNTINFDKRDTNNRLKKLSDGTEFNILPDIILTPL